jgi:hypothetical protein
MHPRALCKHIDRSWRKFSRFSHLVTFALRASASAYLLRGIMLPMFHLRNKSECVKCIVVYSLLAAINFLAKSISKR